MATVPLQPLPGSERLSVDEKIANLEVRAAIVCVAALGLALSCARPKDGTRGAVAPPHEDGRACAALVATGPLDERFADVYHLALGGALLVYGGADAATIGRALDAAGLRSASMAGCGPNGVVVFVPGVDTAAAAGIEDRIRAAVPSSRRVDGIVVPPQRLVSRPQPVLPPAPPSSRDATCAALAGSGSLGARLAHTLPVELGGALFVFAGTDADTVRRALIREDIREMRLVPCGRDDLIVFVPGATALTWHDLESYIASTAQGTRVKERARLIPTPPPAGAPH